MSVTYLKLGGNHLIRSFNCWVSRPMFMKTVESFWHECCLEHTGNSELYESGILWLISLEGGFNSTDFGNQDNQLLQLQSAIQKLENEGEDRQLTEAEISDLHRLN